MKLTLNISDSNNALPLIAYLESLDFLTIENENDFAIPEWHKEIVLEREKKSKPELLLDWDKVKNSFNLE